VVATGRMGIFLSEREQTWGTRSVTVRYFTLRKSHSTALRTLATQGAVAPATMTLQQTAEPLPRPRGQLLPRA
jgi:hypothetical protein